MIGIGLVPTLLETLCLPSRVGIHQTPGECHTAFIPRFMPHGMNTVDLKPLEALYR